LGRGPVGTVGEEATGDEFECVAVVDVEEGLGQFDLLLGTHDVEQTVQLAVGDFVDDQLERHDALTPYVALLGVAVFALRGVQDFGRHLNRRAHDAVVLLLLARQSVVPNFYGAVFVDLDVFAFDIAVRNEFLVQEGKCLEDALGPLFERADALLAFILHELLEVAAVKHFGDEDNLVVLLVEPGVLQRDDVGVFDVLPDFELVADPLLRLVCQGAKVDYAPSHLKAFLLVETLVNLLERTAAQQDVLPELPILLDLHDFVPSLGDLLGVG